MSCQTERRELYRKQWAEADRGNHTPTCAGSQQAGVGPAIHLPRFECGSCRHLICWCMGGDDGDLCDSCWAAKKQTQRRLHNDV